MNRKGEGYLLWNWAPLEELQKIIIGFEETNADLEYAVNKGSETRKLAGFGLAREETRVFMTSEAGTYRWMAPEVILSKLKLYFSIFPFGDYHKDVWFFFCLSYSGTRLFQVVIIIENCLEAYVQMMLRLIAMPM